MDSAAIRLASPDDATAIAKVRVDSWRATYRGMIPDGYLDGMTVEAIAAIWERILTAPPNPTHTFVAEKDGEVVGFASGMMLAEPRHDVDAELTGLYVVPAAAVVGRNGAVEANLIPVGGAGLAVAQDARLAVRSDQLDLDVGAAVQRVGDAGLGLACGAVGAHDGARAFLRRSLEYARLP